MGAPRRGFRVLRDACDTQQGLGLPKGARDTQQGFRVLRGACDTHEDLGVPKGAKATELSRNTHHLLVPPQGDQRHSSKFEGAQGYTARLGAPSSVCGGQGHPAAFVGCPRPQNRRVAPSTFWWHPRGTRATHQDLEVLMTPIRIWGCSGVPVTPMRI